LTVTSDRYRNTRVAGKASTDAHAHRFSRQEKMEFKLKSHSSVPVVILAGAVTLIAALSVWRAHHALAVGLLPAVNALDYRIIVFLNRFAHRSWTLDTIFDVIDSNPLASSPLLMAFWWAWFKDKDRVAQTETREILLHGIVGSFLLIVALRILDYTVPYRGRPLHNPELHFTLPYGVEPNRLLGWSAFPSDHAVMWFFLATTIWYVSRRLGTFLYAYVTLTLCVARIYLGIHYPSDIIVGGLIGIAVARMCKVPAIRKTMADQPLRWMQLSPGIFYAALFIVTEQMMEGFSSLHEVQALLHATVSAVMKAI